MNKKIFYGIVAVLFIVAIVITFIKGLKVGLVYGEGTEINFSLSNQNIEKKDIKAISKEVFPNSKVLIQRIEYFENSALIKVGKADVSEEELEKLIQKINEKYNVDLKKDIFEVNHVQNVQLRVIIEPYIGSLGLSLLVILGYFAVRYKGTKEMLALIKNLFIAEALFFSVYAICRIPVNGITMPLFTLIFFGVILGQTIVGEFNTKED